jgi:hypothetical protein
VRLYLQCLFKVNAADLAVPGAHCRQSDPQEQEVDPGHMIARHLCGVQMHGQAGIVTCLGGAIRGCLATGDSATCRISPG